MKARTGSLIKRSSGYYCRIMVDGKLIVRALKNPDGTPSKTIVDARRAMADFTRPFTLGSKADATQAILRRLEDIRDEMTAKPTVAGCWKAYLASPDKLTSGKHTQKAYSQYTRQFVEWVGARHPQAVYLCNVTKTMAGEYAQSLSTRYNGCTFNKHLIFLRVLFRVLCEDLANPFGKVKTRPIDSVSHEALSQEQLKAILSKAEGELYTLVLCGVFLAQRLGDSCLLKWSQIDFEKNVVAFTPSKTALRSHKKVAIPIHPELKAHLLTLFRTSEYVMPWVAWRYKGDISAMSHKLHRLFTESGIETKDANGKTVYSFHSLRFTLGSALVSSGFSIEVVGQLLAHTNSAMSRHYSTISDTMKEKAIMSLPSVISA